MPSTKLGIPCNLYLDQSIGLFSPRKVRELSIHHEPTGIYFFITLPSNKSTYEGIAYITLTEDVLPAPKLSLGDLNTDTGIDAFATRKKNSLLVVDDQEAIRDLLDDILSEEYIVHLAKMDKMGLTKPLVFIQI